MWWSQRRREEGEDWVGTGRREEWTSSGQMFWETNFTWGDEQRGSALSQANNTQALYLHKHSEVLTSHSTIPLVENKSFNH